MKLLSLLKSFYKNNVFPFAAASAMLTVSLFLFTYTLGLYSFSTENLNIFKKHLAVSDYYKGSEIPTKENEPEFLKKVDTISAMRGVDDVIYMSVAPFHKGKVNLPLTLYNERAIEYSRLAYLQGRECSGYEQDDSEIEFNTTYSQREQYSSGIVLEMNLSDEKSTYSLRCAGAIREPCYYFTLGSFSSELTADDFFSPFNAENILITRATPDLLEYLGDEIYVPLNSFVVVYSPDITPEERAAVREQMNLGEIASSEDIIENSDKKIKSTLGEKLLFPTVLMLVTSFAFIDIVVLTVHKRGISYSVYMLCGATKKTLYFVSGLGTALPSLIPLILNATFVICYPYLYSAGVLKLENVLYGNLTTIVLLVYSLIVIALSLAIQFISIKHSSAIDFRRRFLQ